MRSTKRIHRTERYNEMRAYYNRSLWHLELHDYAEAVKDLTKTIRLYPDTCPYLYHYRGQAYFKLGRYNEALADLNKALELGLKSYAYRYNYQLLPDTYYYLASSYSRLGNHAKAAAHYTREIDYVREPTGVLYSDRGYSYSLSGQHEKAVADFSKAIRFQFKNEQVFHRRGKSYAQLGKYKRAVEDYTKAMTFSDKNSSTYNDRGQAYLKLGLYAKALDDFIKAIKLNSVSAEYYANLGECYLKLNKVELAFDAFTQAIELDPSNSHCYSQCSHCCVLLKNYNDAISYATKAMELKPDFINPYYHRAWAYFKWGRFDEALADSKKSIELGPEYMGGYWDQAFIRHRIAENYFQMARVPFETAIEEQEKNPKEAEAHFVKGQVFHEQAEIHLKEGIHHYRQALQMDITTLKFDAENGKRTITDIAKHSDHYPALMADENKLKFLKDSCIKMQDKENADFFQQALQSQWLHAAVSKLSAKSILSFPSRLATFCKLYMWANAGHLYAEQVLADCYHKNLVPLAFNQKETARHRYQALAKKGCYYGQWMVLRMKAPARQNPHVILLAALQLICNKDTHPMQKEREKEARDYIEVCKTDANLHERQRYFAQLIDAIINHDSELWKQAKAGLTNSDFYGFKKEIERVLVAFEEAIEVNDELRDTAVPVQEYQLATNEAALHCQKLWSQRVIQLQLAEKTKREEKVITEKIPEPDVVVTQAEDKQIKQKLAMLANMPKPSQEKPVASSLGLFATVKQIFLPKVNSSKKMEKPQQYAN